MSIRELKARARLANYTQKALEALDPDYYNSLKAYSQLTNDNDQIVTDTQDYAPEDIPDVNDIEEVEPVENVELYQKYQFIPLTWDTISSEECKRITGLEEDFRDITLSKLYKVLRIPPKAQEGYHNEFGGKREEIKAHIQYELKKVYSKKLRELNILLRNKIESDNEEIENANQGILEQTQHHHAIKYLKEVKKIEDKGFPIDTTKQEGETDDEHLRRIQESARKYYKDHMEKESSKENEYNISVINKKRELKVFISKIASPSTVEKILSDEFMTDENQVKLCNVYPSFLRELKAKYVKIDYRTFIDFAQEYLETNQSKGRVSDNKDVKYPIQLHVNGNTGKIGVECTHDKFGNLVEYPYDINGRTRLNSISSGVVSFLIKKFKLSPQQTRKFKFPKTNLDFVKYIKKIHENFGNDLYGGVARDVLVDLPKDTITYFSKEGPNAVPRDEQLPPTPPRGKKSSIPRKAVNLESENFDVHEGHGLKLTGIKKRGIISGKGIKIEEQDKDNYVPFGKFLLNLSRLKSNILRVVYDKTFVNVISMKSTNVSNDFKDLILELIDTKKVNNFIYKGLSNSEKSLFNKLIKLSGVKSLLNINVDDEYQNKLNQFIIIQGEINAGNNNKELINEGKQILKYFFDFGYINEKNYKHSLSSLE